MANTEVGSAYVTIYPQTDGNFSKQVGKQMGDGVGSGLSSKAVAIGNVISNVATRAADAFGDVFSEAFSSYADYEQLIGGVDTLFKDASATVQENAKNAFKTAGMSANEYMENVTSFSASLISSLDGDTTKAAKVADMAMQDMSDNANKMGSDMESITNAYQGFAKQNYTMLDNLKLGYGGTKTEMERLLADAGKIAGTEFNIDSYADVIEAIHVMQESMDITGTTMKEGSTTISGSINQLQGAWSNFLTSLGDGGATMDMDKVVNDLFESIGAVASNVIPALGRMGSSIASQLPNIVSTAFASLGSAVQDAVTKAFGEEAGAAVMEAWNSIGDTIGSAASTVKDVIDTAFTDIQAIAGDVWPTIQDVITEVAGIVKEVVDTTFPAIAAVVKTAMDGVAGVVRVVWPAVSAIVKAAVDTIKNVINGLKPVLNTVKNVFNGIRDAIKDPIEKARKAVSDAIDKIKSIINGAHLELPRFKLPHFNIQGGSLPWGIGGKGTPPSISVDWYAKGAVFTKPAVLAGVGEGGEPEGVFPLSYLDNLLDEHSGDDGRPNVYVGDIQVTPESELYGLLMQVGETMLEDQRRAGRKAVYA